MCEPCPAAPAPALGSFQPLLLPAPAFHRLPSRPSQRASLSCVGMGAVLGCTSPRDGSPWGWGPHGVRETGTQVNVLGTPRWGTGHSPEQQGHRDSAHLYTSHLRPCSQERNDLGCALPHHPAQGAALDRAHRGASQGGGNLLLCSSFFTELCGAKDSYHRAASLTSSTSQFPIHSTEEFPLENSEAVAIMPSGLFACRQLGLVFKTERENRLCLKYLQLFL